MSFLANLESLTCRFLINGYLKRSEFLAARGLVTIFTYRRCVQLAMQTRPLDCGKPSSQVDWDENQPSLGHGKKTLECVFERDDWAKGIDRLISKKITLPFVRLIKTLCVDALQLSSYNTSRGSLVGSENEMLMMELIVLGKATHPLLPFKMGVPDLACVFCSARLRNGVADGCDMSIGSLSCPTAKITKRFTRTSPTQVR